MGIDLNESLATGGKTKFNRTRLSIPKTQALDAARNHACLARLEESPLPEILWRFESRQLLGPVSHSAGRHMIGYSTPPICIC
jgi:hypothetical protein